MDVSVPITLVLSLVLTLFIAIIFYGWQRNAYNFPPGPRPLPIIGNLHILDRNRPYQTLHQLSKKYGPIYTIQLGVEKVVVLCGYETVKDALVNHADEFLGRPKVPLFFEISKGHGVIFAHYENWKVMRRFTLSTLRDFGMGKEAIEHKISEESDCLVEKIRSYKGEPFDNTKIINAAVANIIVSILLSNRFDYEDPTLLKLLKIVNESMQLIGTPMAMLYNAFPTVMSWFSTVHKTVMQNVDELHAFIRETFTNQKKELDVNDQRNLIDSFLVKQKEEKPNPDLYFTNENLTVLVTDLFAAGMETTSTTLRWGLLLMMKYPEVQKKVQTEIEKVIGLSEPQVSHRKEMPYTDAVIHEIQRFGNIIPSNLPHATTQDVNFRGFFLPKGTHVMPLLTSVLYDKDHFIKADEFYPEHFLDARGNFVRKEAFMPFSAETFPGAMYVSDPITLVLSVVLTVFIALFFFGCQNKANNLPPGPRPLPIIGNLHILDRNRPYQTLHQLSKKYGPIYTIQLGEQKVVVLCGYEAVKDALVNHAEEFSGRPKVPMFQEVTKGHGVIFAQYEIWKVMKRFTLSTLRDFGMGKEAIENTISEESEYLVKKIRSYQGKPFDNTKIINAAVANIIVSILLSNRFDYEDPTLLKLLKTVNESMHLIGTPMAMLYNAFPTVMSWCSTVHKRVMQNMDELHAFIRETFTNQKKELDVNDTRNLIDSFLVKQKEEKPNHELYFTNENLTVLVTDLLAAGIDTTSTTLRWGLLLMMKYPEIQKKVQREIEKVIGLSEPQVIHRKDMPYTDAVIHEIQRFGNILPINLPHATTQDVNFRGYFLPKGTYVMPLLTSVLYDKDHFIKANEFYPEHFLDSSGNFLRKEAFMPFSAGKRSCAGENLAKMELFMFFTRLLQNFTINAPPGAKLDLTPAVGLTTGPLAHEICAITRV